MPAEVERCLSCDETFRPAARYCVSCGVPAVETSDADADDDAETTDADDDDGVDSVAAPDGVIVLGTGERERTAASSVNRFARVMRAVVSAVAVLGAGVVAWLLFSPQTDTVADLGYQLLAVERRVPSGWAEPQPDGQADLVLLPGESGGGPESHPTVEPVEVTETFEADPALAGMELLAGTAAFLTRVDLSSFEQQTVDIPGPVLASRNGWLILDVSGKGLMLASLDDPFDTTPILDTSGGQLHVTDLTFDEQDRLVVSYFRFHDAGFSGEPELGMQVFDLATGRQVESSASPAGWNSAPGLSWKPGVGTFDTVDGDPRFVSDGYPLLAGQEVVLILRCDDPGSCEELWIDRSSGDVLDDRHHSPFRFARELIRPTDRYLTNFDPEFGYFDTETGRQIPMPSSASSGLTGPSGSNGEPAELATEEGLLFVPGRSTVFVYDPDDNKYSRIDLDIEWSVSYLGLVPSGPPEGGG